MQADTTSGETTLRFATKDAARRHCWRRLHEGGLARPPLPAEGRIPNFAGAERAAARLFEVPIFRDAGCLKINPDTPQRHVRRRALEAGIAVIVPTPRLTGDFHYLDPHTIDPADYARAATRDVMARYSKRVPLDALPRIDAIVTGCAAVTGTGLRCGKGAGYSDLEWALLMELGHPPVPVATTVHDVQVVGNFPADAHDLGLHHIATPTRLISVAEPPPGPCGVVFSLLTEQEIEAMPMIAKIRDRRL